MTQHELSPNDRNHQPLDEDLKSRFDSLLRDTAERLEIFMTPDVVTIEAKKVVFGKFNDSHVTMAHIIDDGDHIGIISVVNTTATDRSFFVQHQLSADQNNEFWASSDGTQHSGRMVLRMLDSEWPTADTTYPREEVRSVNRDSIDTTGDISSEYIFGLLENYTFALRHSGGEPAVTGEHSYEVQWRYNDVSADRATADIHTKSVVFDLISSENDMLRQLNVDITVEHRVDNSLVGLTYHINSDNAGVITVNADYIDPKTRRRANHPIQNYEAVFVELTTLMTKMVNEKSSIS